MNKSRFLLIAFMEGGTGMHSGDVEHKEGHVTYSWDGFSRIRDNLINSGSRWEKRGNNTNILWQKDKQVVSNWKREELLMRNDGI